MKSTRFFVTSSTSIVSWAESSNENMPLVTGGHAQLKRLEQAAARLRKYYHENVMAAPAQAALQLIETECGKTFAAAVNKEAFFRGFHAAKKPLL